MKKTARAFAGVGHASRPVKALRISKRNGFVSAAGIKADAKSRRGKAIDENAAAARVIARSEAAIAAGVEMILPADVAEAIARGEPALRAVRKWRDMTQTVLSEATGIDQGTISDMERDGAGLVKNWRKVADALKVPLDLIVPEA